MAFIKIKSGGVIGIEGFEVDVEVDISPGLPSFNIVGLPDTAIKESKERVRSAIKNLGFSFPQKRITVNLSPSHIRKQGTLYDLPIAVGILALSGYVNMENLRNFVFLGEISLDGRINKVNGVLPVIVGLKGFKNFILPLENAVEGAVVNDVNAYGFESLKEVVEFLNGNLKREPVRVNFDEILKKKRELDIDLGEVIGQSLAKKALEISAAGFHNLMMVGSPGSGKSMLAKRIITILPPMTFDEMLEVSKIYSVAGMLEGGLITERPFRSPHHTASETAIIGGGSFPVPGEISLAHKGVLFLDELPEFPRKTLEVLRQPLEDGYINISRAQMKVKFPAEFVLITAQNPCPCGNYGNPFKECTCSRHQIRNYNTKVSEPIKDRMDLKVWMDPVEKEELLKNRKGETSKKVRERVIRAYEIQMERQKKFNGRLTNKEVEEYCINLMEEDARRFLKEALERFNLTGRGYFRTLRVARTVADLEGSERIKTHHIAQALQFRMEENIVL